ncbi:MAG: type II secretion system protein GspN [Desulfatiglandales bacterium]
MKQFISKNKKWFGYVIYCVIVAVGLLYYRFPSDALRDYVQITANNLDTPFFLSVDGLKPWPPFGLKLGQTEISFKDRPDIKLFRTDSLLVRPEAWSFLQGRGKYCFECLAYGGDLKGCIHFKDNSISGPFNTEIELRNIRIGNYEHLKYPIGRHVDGILLGTIYYSGQYKNLMDGDGEANLTLQDGRIELSVPILTLGSVEFNEVKIQMVLKKQKINLARFELKGPQLKGTLSGTIGLKERFVKSTLELKGTIEPFASFFKSAEGAPSTMRFFKQRLRKGALTFIIYGTLGEPKIRFT